MFLNPGDLVNTCLKSCNSEESQHKEIIEMALADLVCITVRPLLPLCASFYISRDFSNYTTYTAQRCMSQQVLACQYFDFFRDKEQFLMDIIVRTGKLQGVLNATYNPSGDLKNDGNDC